MDADCCVVEQMIRDRLADARTSARWAVELRQSKERSRRSNRIRSRLIDVGRSLVNGCDAAEICRVPPRLLFLLTPR